MVPWMIYGANGYTGRLIAEEAARRGLSPVLAGRNATHINKVGARLRLETRIFELTDSEVAAQQLQGVALVLHCAGPFSRTSRPILDGCLRSGCNYLDITGELLVFEAIFGRAAEVRQAGIVALPGVGFDIVPTDCMAAMLKRALPDANHLQLASTLAMLSPGRVGPGTLKTSLEGVPQGVRVRREGKIVPCPPAVEEIPFADGVRPAVLFPGADVSTAYYSTGIPTIETYMAVSALQARLLGREIPPPVRRLLGSPPVQALLKGVVTRLVKGPSAEERARGRVQVWGRVINPAGQNAVMNLTVAPIYPFVVDCALASVSRVAEGQIAPGVYTPSLAFGPDFVLELPGVSAQTPALAPA